MLEREEATHVLMVKLFRVKSPTKLPSRLMAQHFFNIHVNNVYNIFSFDWPPGIFYIRSTFFRAVNTPIISVFNI